MDTTKPLTEVFEESFEEDRKELALEWHRMFESERKNYLKAMISDSNAIVHLRNRPNT